MSLDKIQLPDFLIPSIFKNTLVIMQEETPSKTILQPIKIKHEVPAKSPKTIVEPIKLLFLGGNKKQISIIVKDDTAIYLKDEWLQLLSTILGACKLTIDDVAIINHSKTQTLYETLTTDTAPRYLMLFDVTSSDIALPFNIPHYQIQDFNNAKVLLCPSLALMIGSTETVKLEKTKLWMSLKKMFNI